MISALKLKTKRTEVSIYRTTNTNTKQFNSYQLLLALLKGTNHEQSSQIISLPI